MKRLTGFLTLVLLCGCMAKEPPPTLPAPAPPVNPSSQETPRESESQPVLPPPVKKEPPVPETPYEGSWLPSWETRKDGLSWTFGTHFRGDGVTAGEFDGSPLSGEQCCQDFVWILTHPIAAGAVGDWPTIYDGFLYDAYQGNGGEAENVQALAWERLTGEPDSPVGAFRLLLDVKAPSPPDGKFRFQKAGVQEWVLTLELPAYDGWPPFRRMEPMENYLMSREAAAQVDAQAIQTLTAFLELFKFPKEFSSPADLSVPDVILYAILRANLNEGSLQFTREELEQAFETVYGPDFPPILTEQRGLEVDFYDPRTGIYDVSLMGSCLPGIFVTPYEVWQAGDVYHIVAEAECSGDTYVSHYTLENDGGFWRVLSAEKLPGEDHHRSPSWAVYQPPQPETARPWTAQGLQ